MKNIIIACFVFIGFGLNAQVSDGKIFISGSLGMNSSDGSVVTVIGGTTLTYDGVSVIGFDVMPKVGMMLTENFGAGLGLGYSFTKTRIPDFFDNGADLFEQVEKDWTYTIAPFVRYYESIFDNFYLFGELNIPIAFGDHKELMWNETNDGVVDSDTKVNSSLVGVQFGIGLNYFVGDKMALEAGFNIFGINYYKTSVTEEFADGDKVTLNDSGFNFNFDTKNLLDLSSFTLGIIIFI